MQQALVGTHQYENAGPILLSRILWRKDQVTVILNKIFCLPIHQLIFSFQPTLCNFEQLKCGRLWQSAFYHSLLKTAKLSSVIQIYSAVKLRSPNVCGKSNICHFTVILLLLPCAVVILGFCGKNNMVLHQVGLLSFQN